MLGDNHINKPALLKPEGCRQFGRQKLRWNTRCSSAAWCKRRGTKSVGQEVLETYLALGAAAAVVVVKSKVKSKVVPVLN
jgi:hypothetical protein